MTDINPGKCEIYICRSPNEKIAAVYHDGKVYINSSVGSEYSSEDPKYWVSQHKLCNGGFLEEEGVVGTITGHSTVPTYNYKKKESYRDGVERNVRIFL